MHTTKKIFNSSSHPYQIQSAAISHELSDFFYKGINNSIEFWDCPSKENWHLHSAVDKDSKSFTASASFPCMSSWDSSKKHVCNNIISQWMMSFQASDLKGKSFLDLLDRDSNSLTPSSINGSPWLQHFGHSNSLCTRATRAIVNHTPISKYRLRFFPKENFSCPCGLYPIESW